MHERLSVTALERGGVVAVSADAYDTVVTRLAFASSPARVWQSLMFYEQLDERPPFYLRWLLPVPLRTIGRTSEIGDEARCVYETGHLIKRVTRIEREQLYAFSVVEQELDDGGGVQLSDGAYALRPLPNGGTEVTASTRYRSERAPRWLWRRVEAQVCHLFHRHILRAMRAESDAR